MHIGLIADTHGLLRPEAVAALEGSDLIIHAGDVGREAVLDALRALAPVAAVRGNVDTDPWARELPERLDLEADGLRIRVTHIRPRKADRDVTDVVIFGHSHQPLVECSGGVLWVNPGSAGPRRFRLPVSIGHLYRGATGPSARLESLDVPPAADRRERSRAGKRTR
jgi:putative phosphoesterase